MASGTMKKKSTHYYTQQINYGSTFTAIASGAIATYEIDTSAYDDIVGLAGVGARAGADTELVLNRFSYNSSTKKVIIAVKNTSSSAVTPYLVFCMVVRAM